MNADEALEDFKKNSASYYAIIERITGTGAQPELLYSSISSELAGQINAFPLNLRGFKGDLRAYQEFGAKYSSELAGQINAFPLNLRGFKGDLRAYQEFGAKYILTMKRVLLGDEMGLGKTIQAIAAMAHLYREQAGGWFLVVCPASVMINWCREIQKFSDIPVNLLHGPLLTDAFVCWRELGGESMGKIVDDINGQMSLSMLVIDEAHYIKNPEAKRTQYIHMLEDESERILLMTGTPLENRVGEMCELIGFVRPDLAETVRANAGMRHVPQFKEMLAPVYLRRQRDMVLEELPPITEQEEWCEMTAEDRVEYGAQVLAGSFPGMRRVSFLQKDMGTSSKAARLAELCEQAEDEGRKVIVYSFFRDTIRKVCDHLGDRVVGSITGSTPAIERQDLVDRFSDGPDGSVLVCQVQSGGTGLNIQASLTWQAISRAYRMGQVQNVLVCHLLCQDTADEAVRGILSAKEAEFDLFAQDSAMAEAADGLADQEWIRQVVERERKKYLPAVVT